MSAALLRDLASATQDEAVKDELLYLAEEYDAAASEPAPGAVTTTFPA